MRKLYELLEKINRAYGINIHALHILTVIKKIITIQIFKGMDKAL
jgi:hypothetical protein